jgi:hypothetical protein
MRYILLLTFLSTPVYGKNVVVTYTGRNSVPVPTMVYKPPVVNPNTKPYVYKYVTPCGMIKECRR